MATKKIEGILCRCERCGYEWRARDPSQLPEKCSKCNSPYWNKKKKSKEGRNE